MAAHFGFRRANTDYGIHIQGQQIKKISGPVSFYYLKPSKESWDQFHAQGTDLPLLLLMGDIHFNTSNRCDPCSSPSCYAIEDKSFLHLFDRLAEHTPIDFFTESFRDLMENNTKDPEKTYPGVMGPLLRTTQRAHRVSHRSIPLRNNENQNTLVPIMRWHYTNVRTSNKKIEGKLVSPFLGQLKYFMDRMRGATTDPPPDATVETEVGYVLANIISDIFFVNEDNQIEITTSLLENLLSSLEEEFVDQSMIMKQYRQSALRHHLSLQNLIPLLSDELLKQKHYSKALRFFVKANKEVEKKEDREELDILKNVCHYIALGTRLHGPSDPSQFDMDYFQEAGAMLYDLFIALETSLMDLYFLFRMLKQPKNNVTATLCLAYFGQSHIQTITDLLTSPLFGYTVVYKNVGSMEWFHNDRFFQPIRCMEIRHPLYLEQDVIEHHQLRFGNSPQGRERVKPYYGTIQRERQQRQNTSTRKNKNNHPFNINRPSNNKKKASHASTINSRNNKKNK